MCIFCEIIKGNIPCYKVYEDEFCIAFLDISQTSIGHTLVLPKEHYKNIFELPENVSEHLGRIVCKLSKHIKEKLNISSINILNNNGEIAGQTVEHFHIHLIPRYSDSDIKIEFNSKNLSKEEFNELCEKIKY